MLLSLSQEHPSKREVKHNRMGPSMDPTYKDVLLKVTLVRFKSLITNSVTNDKHVIWGFLYGL